MKTSKDTQLDNQILSIYIDHQNQISWRGTAHQGRHGHEVGATTARVVSTSNSGAATLRPRGWPAEHELMSSSDAHRSVERGEEGVTRLR